MITTRQIEKLFSARMYQKLLHQLMAMRPESSTRLEMAIGHGIPTAAMAIIRLDELNQGHTSIYSQLVRLLLGAQDADGGWGDPLVTAVCLRALMCGHGEGPAIDRGLSYLASLQRTEGLWPLVPIRRTTADPFISAFILFQLGDDHRFAKAAKLEEAANWFEEHLTELDTETSRLWRSAAIRMGRTARRSLAMAAG